MTPAHIYPQQQTIQVTPEHRARHIAPLPATMTPLIGVSDWQPAGDGTYRPIIRLHEKHISIREAATLTGLPDHALRRLLRAGFITGSQPTPGAYVVSIESILRHEDAASDSEFWTEKRRAQWSAAL